jgi:hypothetical protein
MSLREILSSGLFLQSIGIVGLTAAYKAASAETVPAQSSNHPTAEERARQQWRKAHAVQLITRELEGTGVRRVPSGIYGFTFAPATESPLFANRAVQSYEVHKAADGVTYLLAFVTRAQAADIQAAKKTLDLKIYPDPYQDSTEMVCLNVAAVHTKRLATHEPGNAQQVTIEPAS